MRKHPHVFYTSLSALELSLQQIWNKFIRKKIFIQILFQFSLFTFSNSISIEESHPHQKDTQRLSTKWVQKYYKKFMESFFFSYMFENMLSHLFWNVARLLLIFIVFICLPISKWSCWNWYIINMFICSCATTQLLLCLRLWIIYSEKCLQDNLLEFFPFHFCLPIPRFWIFSNKGFFWVVEFIISVLLFFLLLSS